MPLFRRNRWTEEDEARMRVLRLAEYNGRVGQGIVHTKEYTEFMRQEQEWFNREHLDAEELHPLAPWNDTL